MENNLYVFFSDLIDHKRLEAEAKGKHVMILRWKTTPEIHTNVPFEESNIDIVINILIDKNYSIDYLHNVREGVYGVIATWGDKADWLLENMSKVYHLMGF